jgi:hypothetical protein
LSGSAPTLALPLRESRLLPTYLCAVHAAALAAVAALDVGVAGRLALVAGVLAVAWAVRRQAPPAPRALWIDGEDRVRVADAAGRVEEGVLARGSLALPALVLVAVALPSGRVRRHAVFCDALAPGDARRLRARIRMAQRADGRP